VIGILSGGENEPVAEALKIQIYGVSGKSIRSAIESITGVKPKKKKPIYTKETGHVVVQPKDGSILFPCSSSGDCGGSIVILITVLIVMAVFVTIWAIVMIIFSIVTLGGFVRRRLRTHIVVERENIEFLGKLSMLTFRSGGVMNHSLGLDQYDEWMNRACGLFVQLKYLRQVSLGFASIWGIVEIAFKLPQVLFSASYTYDLWPFRLVMLAILIPLILYSPILELKFRRVFETGDESIARLITNEPSLNPDSPMSFVEKPRLVDVKWKGI
jgi:hypothetical protein